MIDTILSIIAIVMIADVVFVIGCILINIFTKLNASILIEIGFAIFTLLIFPAILLSCLRLV